MWSKVNTPELIPALSGISTDFPEKAWVYELKCEQVHDSAMGSCPLYPEMVSRFFIPPEISSDGIQRMQYILPFVRVKHSFSRNEAFQGR